MEGLIIKSISGEYDCYSDGKIITCKPIGLFRLKKITPKVGDRVKIEDNTIIEIIKRKNELVRPFVSNVDKAILITSVIEPDLNLNLLDRLIANIEYCDIEIVIAFSKVDLIKNNDNYKDYENIFNYYKKIGYKVYLLPDEASKIADEINNNICVLVGQSGVGKSTFVNLLTNLNVRTDEISKALGRGKHTTRHTELVSINGGWLADTPGFGSLDFDMDEVTLGQCFKEFFINKCKYNGCLHQNEPGCIIKAKVESGEILKSRYDNYLIFLKEIQDKPKKWQKILKES